MVKPTPDPPVVNLPDDHPLFHFPADLAETSGTLLADRFERQRAPLDAGRCNEHPTSITPRHFWQLWRR